MFRQGKSRAFIHNLRLAAMLSLVAGIVNINGVLSIQTLTTNVTGHFAFFSEEFVQANYSSALTFMVYVIFFLAGAFVCGFLVEFVFRRNPGISHAAPMIMEIVVLLLTGGATFCYAIDNEWIACALLFSMGLQNALVTKISQATVRTTHLTGLFTDLGIELSQLFFYKGSAESRTLTKSIYLRLVIIIFFFFGGVMGGFLFKQYHLRTLWVAAACLVAALLYDNLRFGFHYYRRKFTSVNRSI
jgi:uncharacterized membrane protein YoaK (UPF0700 family)